MNDFYRQLGEYTLTRKIGSGGMAEVWLADRPMMGAHKAVAVKLLNAVSRENEHYRKMFLDEARLSMLLNNSSIVHVFEAGEVDGECFMAMEWVDGINLSQLNAMLWERGERLPVHVAVYIAGEVLRALDHAHGVHTSESSAIVHRDVSPQNVMLSVAGEVKLMDFGVARFSTEETAGIHVKGKLRYMPPEQLQGMSRDPTVDLFAVGAVLHEMIDGKRFRDDFDDFKLLPMIMNGAVPPLSRPEDVPPPIRAILDGLLTADPRMRIGSARGAQRMLSEWPGYRNAAIELESFVTRYRDLVPPEPPVRGSGVSSSMPGRSSSSPLPTQRPDRSSSDGKFVRGVNPSTGTTLEKNVSPEAIDDTNVGSTWPAKSRKLTLVAAFFVAMVGFAVAGLTVYFAIRATSEPEPGGDPGAVATRSEPAKPTLAPAPAPEQPAPAPEQPAPAPAPEQIVEPSPTPPQPEAKPDWPPKPALPPEPAPEPELELDENEDDEDPPPATGPATPPPPKKKVQVTFVANDYRFVWIKVSGQTFIVEPKKTITLKEGRRAVQMRLRETDDWQRIGRIKLEPDHDYEVLILKPGGVKLVETN